MQGMDTASLGLLQSGSQSIYMTCDGPQTLLAPTCDEGHTAVCEGWCWQACMRSAHWCWHACMEGTKTMSEDKGLQDLEPHETQICFKGKSWSVFDLWSA